MIFVLQQVEAAAQAPGVLDRVLEQMRTPLPDVSLWMVAGLLAVLFLLFRRRNQSVDLGVRADDVLRERYESGELSREVYEKLRADVRLRPRL